MTRIVFDIGATNMRVAEIDNGILKDILKMPTPQEKQAGLNTLLAAIRKLSAGKTEVVVGGMAGLVSKEGQVLVSPNLPGWNGCDLTGYLEKNLSGDISIYNDALMAGLGEATYGAGKDESVVAYIGLGTGIGGSRIVNKSVDVMGFEPGHHITDFSGNESWQQTISGRVLTEKHGKYPQALEREVYEDYVRKIAVGVYNAILFWFPEVVIMGGSLMNEEEGFKIGEIADMVGKVNKIAVALPPLRRSELGDSAGLYGAMAIIENGPEAR